MRANAGSALMCSSYYAAEREHKVCVFVFPSLLSLRLTVAVVCAFLCSLLGVRVEEAGEAMDGRVLRAALPTVSSFAEQHVLGVPSDLVRVTSRGENDEKAFAQ